MRESEVVDVSERLTRWVGSTFGADADRVLDLLRTLPPHAVGTQDVERVQASLVIASGGDVGRVERVVAVALVDWRDALVGGGLGHGDWPRRLDEVLGPR